MPMRSIFKQGAVLFGKLALTVAITGLAESDAVAQQWVALPPVPVGVAEVGVGVVDGRIYVVGGTQQSANNVLLNASTANRVYDPHTGRWTEAAPFPVPTSHLGVTVFGGKLYAVGGFRDVVHIGPQDNFYSYEPATNRWRSLPPLPTKRGSVAVAAIGGKVHVFGGRLSNKIISFKTPDGQQFQVGVGTVNTHDVYDLHTRRWSKAAPLPGPARDHMGIAVLNGRIHVFGGRINDFSDMLDRHDVYDPKTDKWTSAAALPEPRSAGAFVVVKGRIVYLGGECKPGGGPGMKATFDKVTAYDPKTNQWSTLPALPEGRQALGGATIGNAIYIIGGAPTCGGGASTDFLEMAL